MARTTHRLEWGWDQPDATAWIDAHELSDFFDGARYARADLERGTVPPVLLQVVS